MSFHAFCSAKFSTCSAVRFPKFSMLHGKGESKYRPVALNFQFLKISVTWSSTCRSETPPFATQTVLPLKSPTGAFVAAQTRPCWGVPFPNPAPASHRWCESGVSFTWLFHPGRASSFYRRSNMAETKSTNRHAKKNRTDTPRNRKTHTSLKKLY